MRYVVNSTQANEEVPQGNNLCLTLLEISFLEVLRLLYLVVQLLISDVGVVPDIGCCRTYSASWLRFPKAAQ